MNAVQNTPDSLDVLKQVYPDLLRLAQVVSLAARVEPQLVRLARLKLLPWAEAGLEADLWFSRLVQARSTLSLVLRPELLPALRRGLAADQKLLRSAWSEVLTQIHLREKTPPLILLEEELVYQGLLEKDPAAALRIAQLLKQAMKTMKDDKERGPALARWALRTYPRLPDRVKQSQDGPNFQALAAYIAGRLGNSTLQGADSAGAGQITITTTDPMDIWVRLLDTGLELSRAQLEGGNPVPTQRFDTIWVEVGWDEGTEARAQAVIVPPSGSVVVSPRGSAPLNVFRIRTVAGDVYTLRALGRPAPDTPPPADTNTTTTEREKPMQRGGRSTYHNFDLLIVHNQDHYSTRVIDSPVGQATVDFKMPFTEEDLRAFFWLSGRIYRNLRPNDSSKTESTQLDPKQFGERLYNAIFAGDVGRLLLRSLDEVEQQGAGLRIRLRLGDVPELAVLPWEYLYVPGLNWFPALSSGTPMTRYIELPEPERALQVAPTLRMLTIVSSPSDLPMLDVEQEWARLQNTLADLQNRGLLVLERLENATLSALQWSLLQDEVHILHFIGHGFFTLEQNQGGLVLEDERGQANRVTAGLLGTLLNDHAPLRLVFLNTNEAAQAGRNDPFVGIAQELVQRGVPAVIAMQFAVSDGAMITLVHEFYRAIANGFPIDTALTEARRAVYTMGNELEWGAPVLFSRALDNLLFVRSAPSSDQGSRESFEPEMLLIPTGPFLMGSQPNNNIPAHETPQHEVVLPDYLIGRYPVTNAQYAEFLKRNPRQEAPQRAGWFNRQPPNKKVNHPVVGVSWHDAHAYCAWLSRETGRTYRLPTEAEWEKAARSTDGRHYPWGEEWDSELCNVNSNDTTSVDDFPRGASPYGCLDMVGNVAEWTSTLWGSDPKQSDYLYPYRADDGREADEPSSQTSVYRIHRGGSFRSQQNEVRCAARSIAPVGESSSWLGFRVVLMLDGTLKVGDVVKPTTTVNLRRSPGSTNKPADDVLMSLPPETLATIASGPRLADGVTWWQVQATTPAGATVTGWMAESVPGSTPLIEKVPGTTAPPAPSFDYDVFISYSSQDKAWVRKALLPQLEAAKLKVIIDFRDFRVGAPTITEMERAVTTSRKTLLILTPAYLASPWAEFENLMLQTLDPNNRAFRLIPLLKEHCDLPTLRYLNYVDFTDPDEIDLAWQKLFASLGAAAPSIQPSPTPATVAAPPLQPPSPDAIRQLQSALATLYPDIASATRIAEEADLPVVSIRLSDRAIYNWHEIIKEAQNHNRLDWLLQVASAEYPGNQALNAAIRTLRA